MCTDLNQRDFGIVAPFPTIIYSDRYTVIQCYTYSKPGNSNNGNFLFYPFLATSATHKCCRTFLFHSGPSNVIWDNLPSLTTRDSMRSRQVPLKSAQGLRMANQKVWQLKMQTWSVFNLNPFNFRGTSQIFACES